MAALAAALTPGTARELALVHAWLDGWQGVGLVVAGMARQDFDLELRGFPQGWRATFYRSGLAHSILAGTGWAVTPWRAIQQAAWKTLIFDESATAAENTPGAPARPGRPESLPPSR